MIPPPLLLTAAILLIQVGAALAKGLMTPENAMGMVLLRNLGAALMLAAVVRPDIRGLTGAQWRDIGCLSLALVGFNGLFYLALPHAPLGIVVTIGFLGPLGVSVIGARRAIDFLWPALALGGALLLAPWDGVERMDSTGLALSVAYAFAWIGYMLMSKRSGRSTPGFTGLAVGLPISVILLAPFGLPHVGPFLAAPASLGIVALVAFFTVLPMALEYQSLKRLDPKVYGVLVATEPGFAAFAGLVLLGERLGAAGWAALVAVSVAAAGSALTGRRDA
jgi:inner membrane transporter RhtA